TALATPISHEPSVTFHQSRLISHEVSNLDARGKVLSAHFSQLGDLHLTLLARERAARMEDAAPRRVERARHFSAEHAILALRLQRRIGYGHGIEQRLRVRMQRI